MQGAILKPSISWTSAVAPSPAFPILPSLSLLQTFDWHRRRAARVADLVRTRNAALNRPLLSRYNRLIFLLIFGAATVTRTPDPLITNEVLYQLSYCGCICPKANSKVLQPPS
jgi:hypothetical protein